MRVVNDRRVQPRVALGGQAILTLEGEQLRCNCVDISATGISVIGPRAAPLREVARVDSSFGPHPLSTEAVIVRGRSLGQGFLWGLRFLSLNLETRRDLESFVRQMLVAAARVRQAQLFATRMRGAPPSAEPSPPPRQAFVPPEPQLHTQPAPEPVAAAGSFAARAPDPVPPDATNTTVPAASAMPRPLPVPGKTVPAPPAVTGKTAPPPGLPTIEPLDEGSLDPPVPAATPRSWPEPARGEAEVRRAVPRDRTPLRFGALPDYDPFSEGLTGFTMVTRAQQRLEAGSKQDYAAAQEADPSPVGDTGFRVIMGDEESGPHDSELNLVPPVQGHVAEFERADEGVTSTFEKPSLTPPKHSMAVLPDFDYDDDDAATQAWRRRTQPGTHEPRPPVEDYAATPATQTAAAKPGPAPRRTVTERAMPAVGGDEPPPGPSPMQHYHSKRATASGRHSSGSRTSKSPTPPSTPTDAKPEHVVSKYERIQRLLEEGRKRSKEAPPEEGGRTAADESTKRAARSRRRRIRASAETRDPRIVALYRQAIRELESTGD